MKTERHKNLWHYTVVIISLLLVMGYQTTFNPTGRKKDDHSLFELGGAPIDNGKVLLKLSIDPFNTLTKNELEQTINGSSSKKQALVFLRKLTNIAKKEANSSYAGFALAGYQRLSEELKNDSDILLAYIDLLTFTHQFSKASQLLRLLSSNQQYKDVATIRLLNISMILGDLELFKLYCSRSKTFNDYRIGIACQLWMVGIQGNSPDRIIDVSNKLLSIVRTTERTEDISDVELWILDLALDLQIKGGDYDSAFKNLLDIQSVKKRQDDNDTSSVIQLVDHFLIVGKYQLAAEALSKFDNNNRLFIRQQISRNIEHGFFSSDAKERVESYERLLDSSKYRLVSLWYWLVEKDREIAFHYAKTNIDQYRTFSDVMLVAVLDKNDE